MSIEAGAIERVATLLAAARTPDDRAPRVLYVAQARIAFDAAREELRRLRAQLADLEAHLLGKSALLKRDGANAPGSGRSGVP